MKIWRFFKTSDNVEMIKDIKDKYPLYAITNKKKLAKTFQTSRSKEEFKMIVDDIDKDEIIDYMNSNRGQVLAYQPMITKSDKFGKSKKIEVLMTDFEYNVLNEIMESHGLFTDVNYVYPDIFKKKYVKILRDIGLVDVYCLLNNRKVKSIDCDFPQFDPVYDQLGLFIDVYMSTIDSDNFKEAIRIH